MTAAGTTYRVLIAEDMAPARTLIRSFVEERPELTCAAVAINGREVLQRLAAEEFDLALLDISMPLMSGIEAIERAARRPYVIFTTAHAQYAVKAFEIGAVDYLLKPISRERFNAAIDRFLAIAGASGKRDRSPAADCLSFLESRRQCILPFDEIVYLASHGKKTTIHATARDYEVSALLGDIEARLPTERFVRVHKQHLVNCRYVRELGCDAEGAYTIRLGDADDTTLPVGRSFVADAKKSLTR